MDEKLTIKERTFVKRYIENQGNATQAALAAYNCKSDSSADAVGRETLGRPRVQKALAQLMHEKGLDDETLLSVHQKLLNDPNPAIQLRALEVAYKISGRFDSRTIFEMRQKEEQQQYRIPEFVTVSKEEMIEVTRIALEGRAEEARWREQHKKEGY